MDVLRRILPRKMKRDQYSFELLKSNSAIELSATISRRRDSSLTSPATSATRLPRNFSQYDSLRIAPSSQTTGGANTAATTPMKEHGENGRKPKLNFNFGAPEKCSQAFVAIFDFGLVISMVDLVYFERFIKSSTPNPMHFPC
ncbi:unnamed protein product [Caenorhabditis angaria]|uniref:Uncharacterized protein n=1 Tax=Caenorhabditis angaria TaxID=860376 RepID=A0A9P1IYB4_9PELO|nr:unnamed protein product [Caenorhabditis angaria]